MGGLFSKGDNRSQKEFGMDKVIISNKILRIVMLLSIAALLPINNVYSQDINTIVLPTSERANYLDESFFDKVIEVKVTLNETISINGMELDTIDQVAPTIMKIDKSSDIIDVFRSKVVLSADKNLPYSIIGNIKKELEGTYKKHLFYKKIAKDANKGFGFEFSKNFNHKLPVDSDGLNQKDGNYKITKIHGEDWLQPNQIPSIIDDRDRIVRALYSNDTIELEKIAQKFVFQRITLLNDQSFKYHGKTYELEDLTLLTEVINAGALVLVLFADKFKYSDYIRFLEYKNEMFEVIEDKKLFKGAFIEIPKDLEVVLSFLDNETR